MPLEEEERKPDGQFAIASSLEDFQKNFNIFTENTSKTSKDIRDNLLSETVTVRTKNCVTIASQYQNRHVQIVLRLYKSISQILTGFDVNCSCVGYNGTSVFASPRALAAFMAQCNDMDLSRRSPSYESRLSKYSHRGFEVYCDFLDRSRIDPDDFRAEFCKLLVLERLPRAVDREEHTSSFSYNAKKIERLFYAKDILLNAE
ncbi:hypothetical protein EV426DRAFT_634139 [Tirmania nivea]|nr:hypothetical protein EV426DRAFT_634139 [Tirmania nivea]